MVDTKTSALTALTGAGVAGGDLIPIDDVSVTTLKNITINELIIALNTLAFTAAYQPLDSDLTSIAALSTTATGRSLLAAADAAAIRVIAGTIIGTNVQAWDADLDSIAALTTTSVGRSLLAAADAAAIRVISAAAPLNQTINAQTGTTYTFALGDSSALVTLSNAGAITATVPTNASVAFPVGSRVDAAQIGAGQVTFAPAGGVTLNGTPGLKCRAQYSGASIVKTATDTWLLVGDLSA